MKPHVALHNYDAKSNAGTPDPSRSTCPMRHSRRNGFMFLHSWTLDIQTLDLQTLDSQSVPPQIRNPPHSMYHSIEKSAEHPKTMRSCPRHRFRDALLCSIAFVAENQILWSQVAKNLCMLSWVALVHRAPHLRYLRIHN